MAMLREKRFLQCCNVYEKRGMTPPCEDERALARLDPSVKLLVRQRVLNPVETIVLSSMELLSDNPRNDSRACRLEAWRSLKRYTFTQIQDSDGWNKTPYSTVPTFHLRLNVRKLRNHRRSPEPCKIYCRKSEHRACRNLTVTCTPACRNQQIVFEVLKSASA